MLFISSCISCSTEAQVSYKIIRNVNIIRGNTMVVEPNQSIMIRGNRIYKILPDSDLKITENDTVINAQGLYAIPGLWDAHIHLSKTKEGALPILVANGITSIRDMGSDFKEVQQMRKDIENGKVVGPHIITSGPMLDAPETLERLKQMETYEDYHNQRVFVDDSLSAFRVVDSLKTLGVDFIKIREYKDLTIYKAVAEASKRNNLDLVGHPPFAMDPVEAANTLGMETWEHASYPFPLPEDSMELKRITDAILENNIAITPTLVAWEIQLIDPHIFKNYFLDSLGSKKILISEYHQKELALSLKDKKSKSEEALQSWNYFFDQTAKDMKIFDDAGITILAGSDQAANEMIPGFSLHDELELMQNKIGMTSAKILQNATYIASKIFHQDQNFGSLEEGKIANILLLRKNPLEDIANTRTIEYVINYGIILDSVKISENLKDNSLDRTPSRKRLTD